jgi:hypothetical protein
MNDYEAHLSSYDHTHKQRLKDMKAMVKDPTAGARARKAEARADGIVSIKLSDAEGAAAAAPVGGAAFKKGGFKKSGFKSAFGATSATAAPSQKQEPKSESRGQVGGGPAADKGAPLPSRAVDSDSEDEEYERYDPRFPTD